MVTDGALLIRAAPPEGDSLGAEDACALFASMLDDEVAPHELEQILAAWRRRRASLAEMAGFMRALDTRTRRLEGPHEGPRPVLLPAPTGLADRPTSRPWSPCCCSAMRSPCWCTDSTGTQDRIPLG